MNDKSPWYAGRCSSRNDLSAYINVTAVKDTDGWHAVDAATLKMFSKSRAVEARGQDTLSLRTADWITLKLKPKGKNFWLAQPYHRLLPFLDLSHLASTDEVHRRLFIEGIEASEQPGMWIIRIDVNEVIQVELKRNGEGRLRLTHACLYNAYPFDHSATISIPHGSGQVLLYDQDGGIAPCGVYDWMPEGDFIERMVRSLAGVNDKGFPYVINWLERNVDQATRRVTINSRDLAAAHEAIRSGELAKRLSEDSELLQSFTEALLASSKIANTFEADKARIIDEARAAAQGDIKEQLAQEIHAIRRDQLAVLDTELHAIKEAEHRELETLHAKRQANTENELAEWTLSQQAKINSELDAKRAAVEDQISDQILIRDKLAIEIQALELTKSQLGNSIAIQEEQNRELAAKLTLLAAETERAKMTLASTENRATESVPLEALLTFRLPPYGNTIKSADMRNTIDQCVLLTESGKTLMMQFIALALAGEPPILSGSQIEDFLAIAETLLSSGFSARLQADPTIITFEDLWIRAGTRVPTTLGHALPFTHGETPRTVLAVVENAERSGARFWFPALADKARRNGLPRHLLVCMTIKDESCDEAQWLREEGIWLEISGAVQQTKPKIISMEMDPGSCSELNPEKRPKCIAKGLVPTDKLTEKLGIARSLRAARAVIELSMLNETSAERLQNIAQLFVSRAK